jgi:hypothetical protein
MGRKQGPKAGSEFQRKRRRGVPAWAIRTLVLAGAVAGVSASAIAGGKRLSKPTAAPSSSRSSQPPGLSLHEQIDRLIEASLAKNLPGQQPALPATDAEFVRRAWLDLAGMIPTAVEARVFLDDPSAYKRGLLVDRLLESPTYARRMQQFFDSMWMERRPDVYVASGAWQEFLHRAFTENRPYDVLVRQVLAADGADPATRPAARFLLDREADPNIITRDVSRLFLGMDLQCCQCHDHPLIDGFKQQHYYGLLAFVNRTVLVGGKGPDGTVPPGSIAILGEKADGEVTFSSVFKKKVTHKTGPRVLDGRPVVEQTALKGQKYLLPADKDGKSRPLPLVSRRALLGPSLTSPGSPAFRRNIVNRLWAMVMGRGLVHPLDMHHEENPSSHPELLDLLATQFMAMKYDIKAFVRELCLTRTYQRSSEPPPDASLELSDQKHYAVAAIRPTSPEQLAWSVMQAVGLVAATEADVAWRLVGTDARMNAILNLDPRRRALRQSLVADQVYSRLAPNVGSYVSHFGGVAGQPQESAEATSTVDQALFLTNGEPMRSWLNPAPGWLIGRLNSLTDSSAIAEEMYLSVLSRRPTQDERAEVLSYLANRPTKERTAALRELAWGLLASTEFRFNH